MLYVNMLHSCKCYSTVKQPQNDSFHHSIEREKVAGSFEQLQRKCNITEHQYFPHCKQEFQVSTR